MSLPFHPKNRKSYDGNKKNVFRAPTIGFEKTTFDVDDTSCTSKFKDHVDALAGHLGLTLKKGGPALAMAMRNGKKPVFPYPKDLDATEQQDPTKLFVFQRDYARVDDEKRAFEENNNRAYELLTLHCSPATVTAMKSMKDYAKCRDNQDGIGLLALIQSVSFNKNASEGSHGMLDLVKAHKKVYLMYQKANETPSEYIQSFQAMIKSVEAVGGEIGGGEHVYKYLAGIEGVDFTTLTGDALTAFKKRATELYQVNLCFDSINKERHGAVKNRILNNSLLGDDNKGSMIPKNYTELHHAMTCFKHEGSNRSRHNQVGDETTAGTGGVAFAQTGSPPTSPNGRRNQGNCHACGKPGHWAQECPTLTEDERQQLRKENEERKQRRAARQQDQNHVNVGSEVDDIPTAIEDGVGNGDDDDKSIEGVGFLQANGRAKLDEDKIYLDTCSSYNQMFTRKHLSNVSDSEYSLTGSCNAGTTVSKKKGWYKGFHMWLNENGIANLLSVGLLEAEGYKIEYKTGGDWTVTTPNGEVIIFQRESEGVLQGFPYIKADADPNGVALLQTTIRQAYEGYSKREVERSILSREAQARLGYPSDQDMSTMVSSHNGVTNIPVSHTDITNARNIFGRNLAAVRGKTVRSTPERVNTELLAIPDDYHRLHHFVTLSIDVMFVNGLAFLVTISRDIRLRTAEYLPTRTAKAIGSSINKVKKIYSRGGYIVNCLLMDQEFDKVEPEIDDSIEVNTSGARDHCPEIERSIRTIKERCRSVIAVSPFDYFPDQYVIHLVYFVTTMLNCLPSQSGLFGRYSPRELVFRRPVDYQKHLRFEFGAMVEASEDPTVTNTMASRTYRGLYLGNTFNIQGTHKVFDMKTGRVKKTRTVQQLPMPDSFIADVNKWGLRGKHDRAARKLEFLNRRKEKFDWDNDDMEDVGIVENEMIYPNIPAEFPGLLFDREVSNDVIEAEPDLSDAEKAHAAAVNADIEEVNTPGVSSLIDEVIIDDDDDDDEYYQSERFAGVLPTKVEQEAVTIEEVVDEDEMEDEEEMSEEELGAILPTKRSRKPVQRMNIATTNTKSYDDNTNVININIHEDVPRRLSEDEQVLQVLGVIMTQIYNIKNGIRKFGERGSESVMKELRGIDDLDTFFPVDANSLTKEQKQAALESLAFIIEKRNGDVKTRKCVNGSKQRLEEGYDKNAASSPTVSNDNLLITCAIDAHEERDVATIDLPSAYLHTPYKGPEVIMVLRGRLAELMVEVNPERYKPFLIYTSKGVALLYVRMNKAMYGMLQSALLFYRKLTSELIDYGFKLNPYDPCVANMEINGFQMTVTWHVDDLKVSHVDPFQITRFAEYLASIYGEKLTVNRGQVHDYLGMDLDYSTKGQVKIGQIRYTKKMIDEFPEPITYSAASPATDYLYTIRNPNEAKPLDTSRKAAFVHTVAQGIFLSKRARRDIQNAVAFLSTRVKNPDEDDWGKLKRLLRYLYGTLHLKLTLEISDTSVIKWWVDASHRVHDDCKGHSGAMMSWGKGAVISTSNKTKIATRSSCEDELVTLDAALVPILAARYFIEAQGYTVEQNIVYQDNQSTIRLAINGNLSSSSRTKHIKARYYFVKEKIDDKEIEIRYCPTEAMWADILTKPLQGAGFRIMRHHLQNCPVDYDDRVEQKQTHPKLLPPIDPAPDRSQPISHCRSVLEDDHPRKVSFSDPVVAGAQ